MNENRSRHRRKPLTIEPSYKDGGHSEDEANPNNSSDRPKSAQATKHLG